MADALNVYEGAVKAILAQLGKDHPRFSEAEVLWHRLQMNTQRIHKYGSSNNLNSDLAEIIDGFSKLVLETSSKTFSEWCEQIEREQNTLASVSQPYQAMPPDVSAQLADLGEAVMTGFDDLKRGQAAIYRRIDEANREPLERLIELIKLGRLEQGEMQATVESIRKVLQWMQRNGATEDPELSQPLKDYADAIQNKVGVHHKLEATLPILPLFLAYKVDITTGTDIDLDALRAEAENRWRALLHRIKEYNDEIRTKVLHKPNPTSSLPPPNYVLGLEGDIRSFMLTIARSLMNTNQWPTSDPNLEPYSAAQLWMTRCREQLETSYAAIQDLESGIKNGRATDPKFALDKRAKLSQLPHQVGKLLTVVDTMDVVGTAARSRSHLRSDLDRIKELSSDEASNLRSLVEQLSWRKPHEDTMLQIEQNLLPLSQLMSGVLEWLDATIDRAGNSQA